MLTEEENLAGLAALNRELVAKAEAIASPRRVVLDMDSTEVRVHGRQEQSAYNGHFESTCYHPLLLFNREGDCLAAKLRPGNVHSADGWEELLLPEIEWQQTLGKEVVFRGDAAFAKPELYRGAGRTGREVRDPPSRERPSAAKDYGVVDPACGTAKLQAGGAVQKLFLSGSELDDGPAGGGEGRVPLRRIVPPHGLHRDQSCDLKPGGGALLQ